MSHMTPAPIATSDTKSGPPATASTPRKHAPVLITEKPSGIQHGGGRTSRIDPAPVAGHNSDGWPRPHPRRGDAARPLYPHRPPAYFEAARMSRAMDRL
jgi:hypothetical protein